MRGAAWLWVVIFAAVSTCMHCAAAAGEGVASTRGEEQGGRLLAENVSVVAFVQKEAFDINGVSLGYSHVPEANWTLSSIGLKVEPGEAPYMYRENASYYIVGEHGTIVEFWQPFDIVRGGKDMAAVHLNVARAMVLANRGEDDIDTVRIKVVNKGWTGIAEDPLCEDGYGCPALVLAGTTHMAYRYTRGEALPLNLYLADWASENGWVLTDDFNKYYFYDFNYDGDWIAIPLVSDTRLLVYNKTTFERYGLETPPNTTDVDRWSWKKFVETAEVISNHTGRPGWYFTGSWDEELKMSLMIAREWGATLYTENDQSVQTCALGEEFVDAMNSTVEVMLKNKWMSQDFVPTNTEAFQAWLEAPLGDPTETPLDQHCCLDPEFDYNTDELWGMSIVAPATIQEIFVDGDIGEAFVPGRFSFLGGSGMFVSARANASQQDYGWELLTGMYKKASAFAQVQRSPPPFESVLSADAWMTQTWLVQREQLRSSVPAQYPYPGFEAFQDLENAKPFRFMWMEMRYKGVNASLATERVVARVNALLAAKCTERNHHHPSCRVCTLADYNHTATDCHPATQKQTVTFAYDPNGTLCFDGAALPGAVVIDCDHVEVTSGFGIAIIIVSCLGGALALSSAVLVYMYRDRAMIKFSQPKFCVLFSLGVAGLCLSNLALVGKNTKTTCITRVTVWGIAFDLAFGALFSKVYRVRRVVCNATSGRLRPRRSFFPLVAVVSLAIVVDIVVLTMWSIVDDHGPMPIFKKLGDGSAVVEMSACASEARPWAIAFLSLKLVLIAWGVYLAWVTRRINYALVEGRQISWSIYLFAVLAAILIFIGSSGLSIEYWALSKAFVFSLSSCTALVMVLVPKLWGAHKQLDVDMSVLTSSATSMSLRANSSASIDVNYLSEPDADGAGTWTVICSHCHQQTDASRGFHTRMKSTAANTLYHTGAGLGVGGGGDGGGPTLRRAAKRKKKQAIVGQSASDFSSSAADRGSAAVSGSGSGVKRGGNVRLAMKDVRSDSAGRRLPPGLYGRDAYNGAAGSAPLGDNFSSHDDYYSSSSVEVRFESEQSNVDGSGAGDRKGCGRSSTEDPRRAPPVRSAGAGVVTAAGLHGVGARQWGLRAAEKNDGGLIRVGRVVTPAAGLRAGPGGSGAPAAAGGWQGSWRRSSESMLSSASLHSELDAASFSRSLQAQAAALRAALCSSNASSNNVSEVEQPAAKFTPTPTASAGGGNGVGGVDARGAGGGGGGGGTDVGSGQGLPAVGACALPPRPSSQPQGARSITLSPASPPSRGGSVGSRGGSDQGGELTASGDGIGGAPAATTTTEGGRPPMQPSALPAPLAFFDKSTEESSDNEDGGVAGDPPTAPRQKSLLLPWIMPGSRRPAQPKVSHWMPGLGRAAGGTATGSNDDFNPNESIGMSSAASVSSIGSSESMRLGAESMKSPTVSPTVSASAASASSDGRRRAPGAIDPNRTWTPVASSRSGGSSLPPRQFSFNLSEFSSDTSDMERPAGLGELGGGTVGGPASGEGVGPAGSTPRGANDEVAFSSPAATVSSDNNVSGVFSSPRPPRRPLRNVGLVGTSAGGGATTALSPSGLISPASSAISSPGVGGGDRPLAVGIAGRASSAERALARAGVVVEDKDRRVAVAGGGGVGLGKGVVASETGEEEGVPLSAGVAPTSGDWGRWLGNSTGSAQSYVSSLALSNVSADGSEEREPMH